MMTAVFFLAFAFLLISIFTRLRSTILARFVLCFIFVSTTSIAEVSLISESAHWEDPKRVITIGGDYNFPPYEFLDDKGQPIGYNVEVSRAIADIMGIKVKIVLDDWDTMRQGLNAGTIDILQGMTITAERQKTISFAPSNVRIQQSIFARIGAEPVSRLDQLRNKQIIVQSQGSMHDYLLENNFDAEIIPITTHVDALRLLSSGKHDYAIVANLPGLYYAKELGLSNLTIVGKPFRAGGYTYATRKGNEALLAEFTEGLAILKNTGRQQEIYTKWLGILEEKDSIPWRYIGLAAVVLSIIMLLITAVVSMWNRTLKSQVSKRTAELHEHQKQLIQADKMSSLGILVSGVAHEVNNPTSLLLLNLPLLKDAWNDAQPILDEYHATHRGLTIAGLPYSRLKYELPLVIDEMSGGAERIKRIVEDLKDFSRYDPEQHKKPIQINRVVQAAIRLVDNSIRKSTDSFTVKYHDATPLVYGDAQRIEQVVVNLLLNACQALPDPSRGIDVQVSHDTKEDQVLIAITDQGTGIKDDDFGRLTDPFFTTKREQGGTGLGLSVSATIVQSHGGTLNFNSTEHEGTRVVLALPVPRGRDHV